MEKELAEFAVNAALELGATSAQARLIESDHNSFLLNNGKLEISSFGKVIGLGMKIRVKNNEGTLCINDLDKEKIRSEIKRILKHISNSKHISNEIEISEEKTYKDNIIVKPKLNPKDVSTEEKIKSLFEIEKSLSKEKFNIITRYFTIADSITKKYLVTSEGTKIYSEVPMARAFWFLTVEKNGQTNQRNNSEMHTTGYEIFKKLNLPEKIHEAAKILHKSLTEGIKAPKGKTDVIAGSEVMGIAVHESAGHPYEADRIFGREAAQAGESFITPEMVGTRIGTDFVTVVDDPRLVGSAGFYHYDDEGVKAREKVLIKKGIINEFLHNKETAKAMNLKSNGSSRASSYDREPIVRMSNTYMKPGDYSEEELLKDTKKGIYVKNFMEWNIDDKRYNQKYTGSEAYLIENGEITKMIKNPTIEITTPALYKSIDALGKKIELFAGNCGKGEPMQGIPVLMGGPIARLRNITIT